MIDAGPGSKGAVANHTTPYRAARPPRRAGGTPRIAAVLAVLVLVVGAIGWAAAGGLVVGPGGPGSSGVDGGPRGSGTPGASGGAQFPVITPLPTPTQKPPIGGTELYGYLPYWQMTDKIAAYLDRVPVSTLALFSVSPTSSGGLRKNDLGYKRITGDRGRALIAAAHARGQRVELAVTSFGYTLNDRLFGLDPAAPVRRDRAVAELLGLVNDLDLDGINVDVEQTRGDLSAGYASFMTALHGGLAAIDSKKTLSAATTSDHEGAILAGAAIAAGANRVFLMGYNYHWSGSGPGASSPIQNRDPGLDLMQSIVDYVQMGVPRKQILLGLPLYGMAWTVAGPDRAFVVVGKGHTWIPANHAVLLNRGDFAPTFDPEEVADYFIVPSGDAWTATYYDSPRTLRPKLSLARSQGLAGAGFWAIGYEYGVAGYLDVMRDFRDGKIAG